MKTASLALTLARPTLVALIVATTVPQPRNPDTGTIAASPSQADPGSDAPIVLAQRCFNVNGQLRCF